MNIFSSIVFLLILISVFVSLSDNNIPAFLGWLAAAVAYLPGLLERLLK